MDKHQVEQAKQYDREDHLKEYRNQFFIDDESLIYLDGNSLGRLPLASIHEIENQANYRWGSRLIRSWNEDWYGKSIEVGNLIAEICGAETGEVVVADSTSINLYKLAFAALKRQSGKNRIITDDANFPSDLYILEGLSSQFDIDYEIIHVNEEKDYDSIASKIKDALDDHTALVSLSHVHFKSAYRYDMHDINKAAHAKGALVLWDLSHSIGAVPVDLRGTGSDLAVGCTYKYLNGGPGSPAFLYVRKDLQHELESPVWGWFGSNKPFDFKLKYQPEIGIRKFLAGTPSILSLSPVRISVEMIIEAGIDRIYLKSTKQSEYLVMLIYKYLVPLGFELLSPLNKEYRGSHVSIKHPEAYRICKALIDKGAGNHVVIPDFREPDIIRLGITPLYTKFEDIVCGVGEIEYIVLNELFRDFSNSRKNVT